MKLVTMNATPFADALRSFLGTVLARHADSSATIAALEDRRLSLRVIVDQAMNLLTIATISDDGAQVLLATVDMAPGSSQWRIVYPDSQAPAADVAQPVH